jgi:hypothetical protein
MESGAGSGGDAMSLRYARRNLLLLAKVQRGLAEREKAASQGSSDELSASVIDTLKQALQVGRCMTNITNKPMANQLFYSAGGRPDFGSGAAGGRRRRRRCCSGNGTK